MVESVQPYDAEDRTDSQRFMGESLDLLNDLARKDRHRGLYVVASWASNRNPSITCLPLGCSVEWVVVTPDGLLEDESVVARFKIAGWNPGLTLEANPNLTIDITVSEAPPPRDDSDTLSMRTRTMMAVVETIIDTFEETLD